MSRISIVMSYYNRKKLLDVTLSTIEKSSIKDYELIIVDDASDEPLVCPQAKVIRIDKKDKWYHNPCIPYNIGFREAKGEIIVIQNPECLHVEDVLKHVYDNARKNLYLSYACYAINEKETKALYEHGTMPYMKSSVFESIGLKPERNGWYNHERYRPVAYHFCSAILKEDLDRIGGGFDERYAHGVAFDDNEFIRRIKRNNLEVQIIRHPYVIHQYHSHFAYDDPKVWRPLYAINQRLFNTT